MLIKVRIKSNYILFAIQYTTFFCETICISRRLLQKDSHLRVLKRKRARKILAVFPDYKRASRMSITEYCTVWDACMKNDRTYRSVAGAHRSEKRDNLVLWDTEYSQPITDKARRLLIFPREEKRSQRILRRKKWGDIVCMCSRLQIITAATHAWINSVYVKTM